MTTTPVDKTSQVHGTAIALDSQGVLLRGASGAGKSDLALRLIEAGGRLVADDRVDLTLEGNTVLMSAPETIQGKLEIRGLGIVEIAFIDESPLTLICDLHPFDLIDRLPEQLDEMVLGCPVRTLGLDPRAASAVVIIRYALKVAAGEIGLVE